MKYVIIGAGPQLVTSFVTTKYGYMDNRSSKYNNFYNCGPHNEHASKIYNFTAMESAIINAISLIQELHPDSYMTNNYNFKESMTVSSIAKMVIILIAIIVYYFIRR
jgi:hypothetical protein